MTRMPAFGLDGPWRDNVGFAQTMEQVTGLAWLTGHEYDQPRIPRGPCDPMAGMSSAFAMLLGLERRDQTGEGSFIEVAMVEAALNAAAEQVIEYTAYGTVLTRLGNRSRDAAPQGLYKCRGEDNWLAISVPSDAQWQSLKEVLGNPSWASSEEFSSATRRHESHDIIDRHLEAWARDQEVAHAVETLIGQGIPAAQVWDARLSPTHPQLVHRKFYEEVNHPLVGTHDVASLPFLFGGVPRWNTSSAPTLGQHNAEILSKVLSVGETSLEELLADGVIGHRPIGID